ncbi:methyltransferase type 11 [Candidatus Moduliflexus flocculans]|uniref:Methyltransferase type 11 n=1 Tax=Candidatus Moduliflexus flocculans TaxID=1499966 RepID=A0A081BSR7_9BACT|nr:methyltransferase type 11 [Candidatus Moduliflexus flocculans]
MAEAYVDVKYLQETAAALKQFKTRTYELMRIQPGHVVLDMGCGPGVDTVPMAEYVGTTGRVLGVDSDQEMIKNADEYARKMQVSERVEHRLADVAALPFESGAFDACRAERLFQVLPASACQPVFAEMLRVTKSGGWIVVADTDWATASIDFPDAALERKLIRFFGEHVRPNGYAGRQFLHIMTQRGLQDVEFQVFPNVQRQFTQSPFDEWLLREALTAQAISHTDADFWKTTLTEREAAGEFYATVNMVIVGGRQA